MINFDKLPGDKPNGGNVTPGTYTAVVFKTEMMTSKTTNSEYLNVSFKIDGGGFVNENYFDSDKPFVQYKLGRLLKACDVTLAGEGSLADVAKVIKGKRVTIDVDVNDRGYGVLDYSGDKEGIYPPSSVVSTSTQIDPEISQAIEADIVDEDF